MALNRSLKYRLKDQRWHLRRRAAARRFGAEQLGQAPIVIGNAMPKSGSHLLHQLLLGLPRIGPFVDPGMPPLTRSAANTNLDKQAVLARLRQMQPGDIGYGYFQAQPEFIHALSQPAVASVFVTRDPRDVLVSHVFYATDIHLGHGMHAYYQALPDFEARLNAAIAGVDEGAVQLSSISQKYERYLGWFDQPDILRLSFENLILNREQSLGQLLDFLAKKGFHSSNDRSSDIAALSAVVEPRRSGTFRGGRVGDWRKHFTESNIKNFKLNTGDLLQRLGYEKDQSWA